MNDPLSFDALFDPAFMAAVQAFSLRIPNAQRGGRLADQRTSARGQGTDFTDFKPYVPGDDLRLIDWNIYRRLGQLSVRMFEERQDMPVYFLVDRSGSMFVESPPRIHAALRTALALAAVALGQQDSVGLFPFAEDMAVQARGISGKANVARIARHLAEHGRQGRTALSGAIDRLNAMKLRRGLVVILSDFFADGGLDPVVAAMARLPHRILMVQLVKPHDADPTLHPDLTGDIAIDGGEGDAAVRLRVTPVLIERYRAAYRMFDDMLTGFAGTHRAGLARIDADRPVIDQLTTLFGAGLPTP